MTPTASPLRPRTCPRGHTLIYQDDRDWCCLACGALWGPDWPEPRAATDADAAELAREVRRSFGGHRWHRGLAASARREGQP